MRRGARALLWMSGGVDVCLVFWVGGIGCMLALVCAFVCHGWLVLMITGADGVVYSNFDVSMVGAYGCCFEMCVWFDVWYCA